MRPQDIIIGELRECPFCGKETRLASTSDKFYTVCNCDAEMTMYFGRGAESKRDAKEALIKAWNTRQEPAPETVEQTRELLIDDIKELPMEDIFKLYKYVRRFCVANIDGLVDPLDGKPS